MLEVDIDWLIAAIFGPPGAAQRRAVAKAITRLESTRPEHRAGAEAMLDALMPRAGTSFRLGITGVPGVGKSTFIEALGLHLIAQGHRVAVLAVDPSSSVSGGSILGDKTRMERLSVHEHAFVRPSPSSGTLGGVSARTREAIQVVEAAGYDVVIVETVGVGQSEAVVAAMTDMFVLLQLPNAGDDLQAIKKGVMELADLVAINKADIDPAAAARAQLQIQSAFGLQGKRASVTGAVSIDGWQPKVLQISALKTDDIETFWREVTRFREHPYAGGAFVERRRGQALAWFEERLDSELRRAFREHALVRDALPQTLRDIAEGAIGVPAAVSRLLRRAGFTEEPTSKAESASSAASGDGPACAVEPSTGHTV